jgi:hypothetical protein
VLLKSLGGARPHFGPHLPPSKPNVNINNIILSTTSFRMKHKVKTEMEVQEPLFTYV